MAQNEKPLRTRAEAEAAHCELRYNSVRGITRPRWASTYAYAEGKRLVGLLVRRPCEHDHYGSAFIAYSTTGEIFENTVGFGRHRQLTLNWYSAQANELPREQWRALPAFYRNLISPHQSH
ncbi:hypothetical protein [Streptomyces sp. NPDC055036]